MPKIFKDKNNNVLYTGYETSEVVANPTLAGTEADLTGLQVGDTKYKVSSGGGVIYRYTISLFAEGGYNVLDKITVLSSENYDLGEEGAVTTFLPNLTQLQLKELFDCVYLVGNPLIETLDTSTYNNSSSPISSDLHFYQIINNSTSENVVNVEISYNETNNTYTLDTSSKVGNVSIIKEIL